MSSSEPVAVEHTTALALEEKAKLHKSLRRIDMVLFTVCALVGLDTLGKVSGYGPQTFAWVVILAVTFLLPYALVMAELGTAFPQEGGPYEWMKMAWGRFAAAVGSVLYWITNPLWVGGSLAFLSTEIWSTNIHNVGSGTIGDYIFKLLFIWFSITVAIISLRRGKWIPNAGAIARFVVLGFFSITVLIYAIKHGVHGYAAGDFKPTDGAIFLGLTPLLLFNYVGFELQNGAAEEMENPQHDVPVSIIRSGVLSAACYIIPVFGILAVLPTSKISGIGGFIDAVNATFSVYGGAAHFLTECMAIGAIFALMTSGAVWMMGADRIQAVAAYDGGAPGFFGKFNATLGTPVRVNVASGILATAFMVFAQIMLNSSSGSANTFNVVLYLATSTTLLSYLLIFPAAIVLRRKYARVHRSYVVPGGNFGLWLCVGICTAWMALGSWVAIFPGSLEHIFGYSYNVPDTYGVSWAKFEVFTLGTLGLVVLLGVACYLSGAPVRRREVDIPLETALEPATGD
jgi:glutamate:GABA antiporter